MTFERNETKNHGGKIIFESQNGILSSDLTVQDRRDLQVPDLPHLVRRYQVRPPFIDAVTHTWSFLEGQDSRRR